MGRGMGSGQILKPDVVSFFRWRNVVAFPCEKRQYIDPAAAATGNAARPA